MEWSSYKVSGHVNDRIATTEGGTNLVSSYKDIDKDEQGKHVKQINGLLSVSFETLKPARWPACLLR